MLRWCFYISLNRPQHFLWPCIHTCCVCVCVQSSPYREILNECLCWCVCVFVRLCNTIYVWSCIRNKHRDCDSKYRIHVMVCVFVCVCAVACPRLRVVLCIGINTKSLYTHIHTLCRYASIWYVLRYFFEHKRAHTHTQYNSLTI